ncbi:SdpI family protein [Pseudobutyrivibrio sp.]|uniref:SdpI family protein n=1 Tax=Pseudobutyrivibrio sp. TaxID=2014367 RepID=UPI0025D910B9|nr:SdpI family protein [Pseudobutyrivibrio sp.]
MWFYYMMFICNLFIPIVMLICGFFMFKYPPKEINGIVGYRTTMSRKNKDTWKFAHDYCGRLWMKLGLLLLILSIIIQIPFAQSGENAIGYMTIAVEVIQLVALLGSIVFVERALKKTFDENGVRR